jgi:hypothetical protein
MERSISMKKNPFKDKKIIFRLHPNWHDGSSYKFPYFLKKAFGIEITREKIDGKYDLGICKGDWYTFHREFMDKGIPYLLLEHDIYSFRFGLNEKSYAHDKEKIENAVAVIFTSEDYVEYYEDLKKKYGWHIPKYVVIHNKPLTKDLKFTPREKLEGLHLVLEGGLSIWKKKDDPYHYKAYNYIFEQFINAGWNVHIYPTKVASMLAKSEAYKALGCIIHEWIPCKDLYQEISQYTAGFQGFNSINTPESSLKFAQACRPNKIYDYLASGIPTIGYNGKNAMEIYRDKWGVVIDDLKPETLAAIPERLKKIKITKKMRNDNVLEKERDKFEYIINVALEEAENKDRVKYNIGKNPFENTVSNPFAKKFPIKITVENKTPCIITRINRSFLPHSISEVFTIDKMDYKQLRAHVNLIIKEIGGE